MDFGKFEPEYDMNFQSFEPEYNLDFEIMESQLDSIFENMESQLDSMFENLELKNEGVNNKLKTIKESIRGEHKMMIESMKQDHSMNFDNFTLEQSYNEILVIRTIDVITMIVGVFILFFGCKKIKFTSSFFAYNLLAVFKSDYYNSISSGITGFQPYYIDLIDYLVFLPCLSAIFYRYPKPIIYLLSLLTGIHISIFINPINPIQAYIPQLAFLLFWSAILFTLYQTYHKTDKMVIISTSYIGSLMSVSSFINNFLDYESIEKYGLKSKDFYGFLIHVLTILGLAALGALYQFNSYYKSKTIASKNNIKKY